MKNIKNFLRPASIIAALPNTISNGQTADATPLMADLNHIVNQVNANAAPLSNTALLDAANTFTAVQSGIAATAAANFPIVTQVRNRVFNTLTSTLGTNTITARCAALSLGTYASGQIFTFVPSQTNTGPANMTVDAAGSTIIFSMGSTLIGGELLAGVQAVVAHDGTRGNLVNPQIYHLSKYTNSLQASVPLNNTANFFDGPSVPQGTVGIWYASGTVTLQDTAGSANFNIKLWDGTTVFGSTRCLAPSTSQAISVSVSGFISSPTGDIRISVQDVSSTSGAILNAAESVGNFSSTVTAIRIG